LIKLCDIDKSAKEKLPPRLNDKSGVGVHYTDAFLKPMNKTLEDGTRIACKRKGLKISLIVGTKKGEGLMRRIDISPDPVLMLNAALLEAARSAGVELQINEEEIFISP
jgi:hypothetical protein